MVLPASNIVLPSSNNTQEMVEICDELDIFTTAQHFHELKLLAIQESYSLTRMDNPQNEKQIKVDPISLRESSRREAIFNVMLSPPANSPDGVLWLPPLKSPLENCSLPSSALSSPRFSFALLKKKLKNESQASPRQIERLASRHSSAQNSHLSHEEEINLRRSRSCAEGRSSSGADELDLWFNKPKTIKNDTMKITEANSENLMAPCKNTEPKDDEFRCGALCMYLPGFGKGKPVKSKKELVHPEIGNIISRTVSLEKFECGSWASSAIINDHEDDSMNLYFDLPLELIRNSVNDATSPVAAAFVFDKDRKGVLKNGSTRSAAGRKSHESARHVRFSTSSSTSQPSSPASCITPRLRKAREDFNAFLEAQRA